MDLAQARTEFLAYVAVERGLSVNTLDAYTRDLEGYLLWLNGKKISENFGFLSFFMLRYQQLIANRIVPDQRFREKVNGNFVFLRMAYI